jgi:hypothetical protein
VVGVVGEATYVLDVVGEVKREVERGIDEGDVVLTLALVPETNEHLDGLASSELCVKIECTRRPTLDLRRTAQ